jgi:hypothetical protein
VEVYGPNESIVPLSAIDFQNYRVSSSPQFHLCSQQYQVISTEIEEVKNKAACGVEVTIHRTDCLEEHLAGESMTQQLSFNLGFHLHFPIIQLIDGNCCR